MSNPTALVTLADVKDHLNIAQDDTGHDTELQGFIDAATKFIQDRTGPILAQDFTEIYDGGGTTICLRNPPILTMTSVVEYIAEVGYTLTKVDLGDTIGQYSYTLDSATSGIIRRRYNGGIAGMFAPGERNVVVTYTAGTTAVAADVRMATLQDIAGLFQPSQLGMNPAFNVPDAGNAPLNPIGLFPRVAEILAAPAMRTPSIA